MAGINGDRLKKNSFKNRGGVLRVNGPNWKSARGVGTRTAARVKIVPSANELNML